MTKEARMVEIRTSVSVSRPIVAQSCTLSVSVQIVAGRDDFAERGCVRSTSRSASEPPEVPVLHQRLVWCLPAAAGPADTAALLWLRLCRAATYRRVALCQTLGDSAAWDRSYALPNTIRRPACRQAGTA